MSAAFITLSHPEANTIYGFDALQVFDETLFAQVQRETLKRVEAKPGVGSVERLPVARGFQYTNDTQMI